MADLPELTTIQVRRGTAARWAELNLVLAPGEPGFEIDTRRIKVGDGVTAWNDLPYASVPPDNASWIAYTPSISSASGAIGSATTSGRYKVAGKTAHVRVRIDIASNGSAGGWVGIGLPVAARAGDAGDQTILAGRETAAVGAMLCGLVGPLPDRIIVLRYDNAYPGADGYTLQVSGAYEIA